MSILKRKRVRFATVLADPPWKEQGGGKVKRGADRHYPLMNTPQIIECMQGQLTGRVADDAHMFLWVTNNFLPDGLEVMEACGFRYVTNIVWAKTRFGIGQYFRGKHELCLFGVRGSGYAVRTECRDLSSLLGDRLIEPTAHSRKPDDIHELIEARSIGPYIELFARRPRAGWVSWGNEV
jgi:N6-adenosine-specific RNA methylase IME4